MRFKLTRSLIPSLFTGLGTLKNKYDIRVKPDTKPFSLSTSRDVPIPLHAKVQAELEYIQSLNVISKVDQPTPWRGGPKEGWEGPHLCGS